MNKSELLSHFSSSFGCFAYTNGNYWGGGLSQPPLPPALKLSFTVHSGIFYDCLISICQDELFYVTCVWFVLAAKKSSWELNRNRYWNQLEFQYKFYY